MGLVGFVLVGDEEFIEDACSLLLVAFEVVEVGQVELVHCHKEGVLFVAAHCVLLEEPHDVTERALVVQDHAVDALLHMHHKVFELDLEEWVVDVFEFCDYFLEN